MPRRIEKLREAGSTELEAQQRDLTEQIFRLKFQLSTGQAEALKRLRDSRKDLARVEDENRFMREQLALAMSGWREEQRRSREYEKRMKELVAPTESALLEDTSAEAEAENIRFVQSTAEIDGPGPTRGTQLGGTAQNTPGGIL